MSLSARANDTITGLILSILYMNMVICFLFFEMSPCHSDNYAHTGEVSDFTLKIQEIENLRCDTCECESMQLSTRRLLVNILLLLVFRFSYHVLSSLLSVQSGFAGGNFTRQALQWLIDCSWRMFEGNT